MSRQPSPNRTLSSPRQRFLSSRPYGQPSDLDRQLKRRNLRHQGQLKNLATRKATNLIFKYNARSTSELYDQCTSDEWADLIYTADSKVHNHVNSALELYIKDSLVLQRQDRWGWFVKCAENLPAEIDELNAIFRAQNIDISDFANDLYDLLMCIDSKKNCLRLTGIANSGKSLIAQLIVKPFISAYVNNHNSENEFYLSSFLNKSVCLCEELMCTPATAEDFKSILGGANIDISKKYSAKQMLTRTPIIVTSNHRTFGRGHLPPVDEHALSIRCYHYKFTAEYKPKITVTLPALAYLMLISCTR